MSVLVFVRSRVFLALSAMAVALVVAAACNGDGGTPEAEPPAEEGTMPEEEAPAEEEMPAEEEEEAPVEEEMPAEEEEAPAEEEPPAEAAAEIMMVPSIRFDLTELTIPADTDVTITADNTDTGFSHSFAVYISEEDALGGGETLGETEICVGPCTDQVTVNLVAGSYFFRCEVHPTQMTGTLIVQ